MLVSPIRVVALVAGCVVSIGLVGCGARTAKATKGGFPERVEAEHYSRIEASTAADLQLVTTFVESQRLLSEGAYWESYELLRDKLERHPGLTDLYLYFFRAALYSLPQFVDEPRGERWVELTEWYERAPELLPKAEYAGVAEVGLQTAQYYMEANVPPEVVLRLYRALGKLGADEFTVQRTVGSILLQQGDFAAAETAFKRCLELQPDAVPVIGRRFQTLIAQRKNEEAELLLRESMKRLPGNPTLSRLLALLRVEQKRLDEAAAILEQAVSGATGTELADIQIELAEVRMSLGQPEQAIRLYRKLLTSTTYSGVAARSILQYHVQSGQFEQAEAFLLETENLLSPKQVDGIYALYGFILLDTNHIDRAAETFDDLVDRQVRIIEPYEGLYRIATARKDWEQARRVARAANSVFSGEPFGCVLEGRLYLLQEKYAEGLKVLEDCAERFPSEPEALFNYAMALERTGSFKKAEPMLIQVIATTPEDHSALNYLAYAYAERSMKLDLAEDYVKRALRLRPNSAAYLDTLGWVYYQKGDFEQARQNLTKAAEQMPEDPIVLDHLADTLFRLGELEKSLLLWRKALANVDEAERDLAERIANKIEKREIPKLPPLLPENQSRKPAP